MISPYISSSFLRGKLAQSKRLQVDRVQVDGSGETVGFTYGKAPAVLREIAFPRRSLQLDWEPQPWPVALDQSGDDPCPELSWFYGVKAISEKGAPTYRRAAGDYVPAGPEETGVPSWIRQSRHFAFAATLRTGGACKTFVRDRWILQGTGRKPNPKALQTHRSFAGHDDGDIPTFEWNPRERSLLPVPGEMTRRLDWEPGTNRPPDLHRAAYRDRTPVWGLMGGMMPGGGHPGGNPALDQLKAMAAQATAQGLRAQAEQQARAAAIQARVAAQAQAQIQQAHHRQQAMLQATCAAAMVEKQKKRIEEEMKQLEEELKGKDEALGRQEEENKRRIDNLKRQAEELERQINELERQAE